MNFLITGVAGFIGSQVAKSLLEQGNNVIGIDSFTDYYPRFFKELNLEQIRTNASFIFIEQDIMKIDLIDLFSNVEVIIHLAAQAGVRYSWGDNFQFYFYNNVLTTQLLLEAMKKSSVRRMVYASSSSVYGNNCVLPYSEDSTCWPVSPYGVTKLAAEHLCSLYYKNFNLDIVSLRYFTVYGPHQRPDMFIYRYIQSIFSDKKINIYGDGSQSRDFIYVSDIVKATIAAAVIPEAKGCILNIGSGESISINRVMIMLEEIIGDRIRYVQHLAVAKGDVYNTHASINKANNILKFIPRCSLREGLAIEVEWVRDIQPIIKNKCNII